MNRGIFYFFPPVYFSLKHACLLCLWFPYAYLCSGLQITVVIITEDCFSIALACTGKKREKKKKAEVPQKNPCRGSNADAEIKLPLLRAVNVFPLKPGVGQNTATHASPAAWNFLLVLNSTLLVHSPTLLFSTG